MLIHAIYFQLCKKNFPRQSRGRKEKSGLRPRPEKLSIPRSTLNPEEPIFILATSSVIQHFPNQNSNTLLGEWFQCKFFYANRLRFFL